jgi:hypothetical protein
VTILIGAVYFNVYIVLMNQNYCRVWCVRFNPFHDQLILSASSDARVLISSAASVSSENNTDVSINDETETKQM